MNEKWFPRGLGKSHLVDNFFGSAIAQPKITWLYIAEGG